MHGVKKGMRQLKWLDFPLSSFLLFDVLSTSRLNSSIFTNSPFPISVTCSFSLTDAELFYIIYHCYFLNLKKTKKKEIVQAPSE